MESPEVREAREQHERAWMEAARMNGVDVDTNGLYNQNMKMGDDDDLEGQVSNQHQSLVRYPLLPYSKHISNDNADSYGRIEDESVIVDASSEGRPRFARQQQDAIEDVTSDPRGFFYNFDYQVPFIRVPTEGRQSSNIVEVLARASDSDKNVETEMRSVKKVENKRKRASQNHQLEFIPVEQVRDDQTKPKPQTKFNRSVKQQGRGSIKFKHTV
jgi:hypothetical protein